MISTFANGVPSQQGATDTAKPASLSTSGQARDRQDRRHACRNGGTPRRISLSSPIGQCAAQAAIRIERADHDALSCGPRRRLQQRHLHARLELVEHIDQQSPWCLRARPATAPDPATFRVNARPVAARRACCRCPAWQSRPSTDRASPASNNATASWPRPQPISTTSPNASVAASASTSLVYRVATQFRRHVAACEPTAAPIALRHALERGCEFRRRLC